MALKSWRSPSAWTPEPKAMAEPKSRTSAKTSIARDTRGAYLGKLAVCSAFWLWKTRHAPLRASGHPVQADHDQAGESKNSEEDEGSDCCRSEPTRAARLALAARQGHHGRDRDDGCRGRNCNRLRGQRA